MMEEFERPPAAHTSPRGEPVVFTASDGEVVQAAALRSLLEAGGGDVRVQIAPSATAGQHLQLSLVGAGALLASAAAVAALPTFAWAHAPAGAQAAAPPAPPPACAICTEDLEEGCRVTSMPCGHLFHAACLMPWLRQHHTCPMCRFRLPTDERPVACDRVRPASSAPARLPAGAHAGSPANGRRPPHGGVGDGSAAEPREEGGGRDGDVPVLWTSIHRPASASNPATWSMGKLRGVLDAGGVSYQHCNDRSSLVEMVVMCLRDYAGAGAQYDQEQLRSLHSLATTAQEDARSVLSDDADAGLEAQGAVERDASADRAAGGHARADAPAGASAGRPDVRGRVHHRGCSAAREGGGWEDRRERCADARGSMQEMLHLARNGQVEELSRAMHMASAARATRTRAAEIQAERECAAEQERLFRLAHCERQRARQSQRLRGCQRHMRYSDSADSSEELCSLPPPPPPPRTEDGMRMRPALEEAGGRAAAPVSVAARVQDSDFGWCEGGGGARSRGEGVAVGGEAGGGNRCLVRGSGGGVVRGATRVDAHCKSRSPVVKVAAGKDRSVFE